MPIDAEDRESGRGPESLMPSSGTRYAKLRRSVCRFVAMFLAALIGHYPRFATYNVLQRIVPEKVRAMQMAERGHRLHVEHRQRRP